MDPIRGSPYRPAASEMAALKGLTEVRNRSHAQKVRKLLHHGRQPQKFAVVRPSPVDLDAQSGIRLGTQRRPLSITRDCAPFIISGRGQLQCPADWPDPEGFTAFLNECYHLRNGRSSSATAKYADASRKISLACRSSRFSRSSCLIRAFSALVCPGRSPPSRWT